MSGFIKLHRKFREWEWYSDSAVKDVFLHLLLAANWEEVRWKGKVINAGQLITTVKDLSEELNITTKRVRTALAKLEQTGEISKKAANKYTLITIENWGFYQGDDSSEGKQRANKGQTYIFI